MQAENGIGKHAAQPASRPEQTVPDYITFPRKFISYRWFKPLLVGVLAIVFMFIIQIVLIIVATVWSGNINFINTIGTGYDDMNPYTGPGALIELGGIVAIWLGLMLAAIIVRDRPFSSYSSSRGGWNWSAFFKCLLVAVVVMGLSTAIGYLIPVEGAEPDYVNRFTIAGIVMCAILVPLQCVTEEYIFRGYIMQTVGSWVKHPVAAPILGIAVSAIAFAAGHPYNDIGVVLIFCNGVIWCVVAWLTRGLEATSAVHIVNNYMAFYFSGFGLQVQTSQVGIPDLIMGLAVDIVYAAAVILLGRKFNWFKAKGDGFSAYNEKKLAGMKPEKKARLVERGVITAEQAFGPQNWQPVQPNMQQGWKPQVQQAWQPQAQQTYPQQGYQQQAAQQVYPQQAAPQAYPQQTVQQAYPQQTYGQQAQQRDYPEPPLPR